GQPARHARYLQTQSDVRAARDAELAPGRTHGGKDTHRNAEQVTELLRPRQSTDVVEERAGGVRRLRGMGCAVREPPDEPGIDRAECQLAGIRAATRE